MNQKMNLMVKNYQHRNWDRNIQSQCRLMKTKPANNRSWVLENIAALFSKDWDQMSWRLIDREEMKKGFSALNLYPSCSQKRTT